MRFAASNLSRLAILAVVLGLLVVPSECHRFPGPHSLFMAVDAMAMAGMPSSDAAVPSAAHRHAAAPAAPGRGVSVFDIPTGDAVAAPDEAAAPPQPAPATSPLPGQVAVSVSVPAPAGDAYAVASTASAYTAAPLPEARAARLDRVDLGRWAGIAVPPQSPPPRTSAA